MTFLAIDFLGLPTEYRAECGTVRSTDDGRLSIGRKYALDAGGSKISLYLGSRVHSVMLRFPAYGAPEALIDWERRFRAFVEKQKGWE